MGSHIHWISYTRLIKKFRDDETASRVDFLSSHVYLFDSWARDRINRIALHMQTKCYTPAQKCLLQGHEPEGLLFLFRGSVKVFRSPVTYMSKAEANLRQRMSNGGMLCGSIIVFVSPQNCSYFKKDRSWQQFLMENLRHQMVVRCQRCTSYEHRYRFIFGCCVIEFKTRCNLFLRLKSGWKSFMGSIKVAREEKRIRFLADCMFSRSLQMSPIGFSNESAERF